jgi:hypothetical protein
MSKRVNNFENLIRFFLLKTIDDNFCKQLNNEIIMYNSFVDQVNIKNEVENNKYDLPLKKLKIVTTNKIYSLWLNLKIYIDSNLKNTVYYDAFINLITFKYTHTKYEYVNHLSKSTYYSFIDKSFEVIKEYLLYYHLMIL